MNTEKLEKERISVIGEVGRIIAGSRCPEDTLQRIAELISKKFNTNVCSIYLLDADKNSLVLRATVGLSKESVSKIGMSIHEGLTGLVLEKMTPVFVVNPSCHPRYKFFAGSGEELYNTFLGVPLVYHQELLGVLVVQTLKEKDISEPDIHLFSTIASQISATAAYSGLIENLKREQKQTRVLKKKLSNITERPVVAREKKKLLKGFPVSGSFSEGYAHYLGKSIGFDEIDPEEVINVAAEIKKLDTAFKRSQAEITRLIKKAKNLSGEGKAILDVHFLLLKDRSFKKKVKGYIRKKYSAEYALKKVVSDYLETFSRMDDLYLRERGADIEAAAKRVLKNLLGIGGSAGKKLNKESVLIASDISPADLVALRQKNLKAIVLSRGGKTSHTVIIARSFEIPMVVGVKEIVETVKEDDFLIVDGTSGIIFNNPSREVIKEYQRLKDEKTKHDNLLHAIRDLPAKTKDGYQIMLGANISLLSDLDLVKKYGAEYIGLYRTEFPFLVREQFPSEEEQFQLYKKIGEGAQGKGVSIRTLDVGGDKFLSYLDYPREENPYLGWRSIRVSLELDDIFRTQIRAVLRASVLGNINLMFPMITSAKEVRNIIAILNEEKMSLHKKNISFNEQIKIGIMVEVPAAVKILDKLLRYIDFVSIGTNDLIQYTLAVDRNNPRVASLYNPLHPAVISTILETVAICKRNNKRVSICGEAASNPKCAYLFLAMEIDQLSMNPSSVPVIKDLIRKARLAEAKNVLSNVIKMEEAGEIADFLNKTVF